MRRTEPPTISIYRQFPSGAVIVSSVANGGLITRTYIGYTVREAAQDFKRTLKSIKAR